MKHVSLFYTTCRARCLHVASQAHKQIKSSFKNKYFSHALNIYKGGPPKQIFLFLIASVKCVK